MDVAGKKVVGGTPLDHSPLSAVACILNIDNFYGGY